MNHAMATGQKLFQFTPLREGRPLPFDLEEVEGKISIHAPAGGATAQTLSWTPPAMYFNSRPCGRGDAISADQLTEQVLFQFTPLREGRLIQS